MYQRGNNKLDDVNWWTFVRFTWLNVVIVDSDVLEAVWAFLNDVYDLCWFKSDCLAYTNYVHLGI